jgi:hypothetical protein
MSVNLNRMSVHINKGMWLLYGLLGSLRCLFSHLVFSVWFVWDCVHQFNEEFCGGAFGFFFFFCREGQEGCFLVFVYICHLRLGFESYAPIQCLCLILPHIVMSPVMRLS